MTSPRDCRVCLLNRFSAGLEDWPLLVAVDVGNRVGFGHLKRCIAIGEHARLAGAQVNFQIGGDFAAGFRLIEMAGFDCSINVNESAGAKIILADRVHAETLDYPQSLEVDIARWREDGARIVLIDGAGTDSLRHLRRPHLPIDLFVAPYAGERQTESSIRILAGPAFAPLGAEYQSAARREIRPEADQILVSCGGSDPFEITARIMAALEEIRDRRLVVQVVLGPGFEPSYRAGLVGAAHNSPHRIECVNAPDSLAPHMRWCDLAVTTSGLTKYELAATGTPALLISPDEMHARANEPFAELGSAADLGAIKGVTPADIASLLRALLNDRQRRFAMSRAGMREVDGRGAARIASALRELFLC